VDLGVPRSSRGGGTNESNNLDVCGRSRCTSSEAGCTNPPSFASLPFLSLAARAASALSHLRVAAAGEGPLVHLPRIVLDHLARLPGDGRFCGVAAGGLEGDDHASQVATTDFCNKIGTEPK